MHLTGLLIAWKAQSNQMSSIITSFPQRVYFRKVGKNAIILKMSSMC